LEVLYSARSPSDYATILKRQRTSFVNLPMTQQICARAIEVQSLMAKRSQHRGLSTADLLIVACGELYRVPILHYDRDFDRIAAITGQVVRWVVPQGTVR